MRPFPIFGRPELIQVPEKDGQMLIFLYIFGIMLKVKFLEKKQTTMAKAQLRNEVMIKEMKQN